MNKCKKCGTEFEGKFCPQCGTPWLEAGEKICPKCTAVLKASAKFCSECGYSFETPQSEKRDRQLTGGTKKLYAAVRILPAALLALFSVLLFFLYLTPVAVMPGGNLMGVKIPDTSYGNVYEISNYEEMSFTGSMTALIVCAAIALFFALLTGICCAFYKLRDKRFAVAGRKIFLRSILTAIGYALFFVLFLTACIMMGQIKKEDGGLGLMKAGIAPILVLVFMLVGILVSLLCALAGVYLRKKYPALVAETEKRIAAKKPTGLERWIKGHKVLTGVLSAVVIAGVVVGVAVPVGLANRYNGTYYAYNGETEEYNMEQFYKLSGDVWTDEDGERGKITFDRENVTLSRNLSEGGDIFEGLSDKMEGTINGDILKIGETVYAKTGHKHKAKDGNCACGAHFSVGLKYEKVDGGWAVTGIGTCKDTDIVIPGWHKNKRVKEIGAYAFSYHRGLMSVTIPNSVTSIGEHAFDDCDGLERVNITNPATWCKINFEDSYANPLCYAHHLYMNGEEVTALTIPNEITEIKDYAFLGCSGLTSVTIGSGVTEIRWSAFSGCSKLTSVTIGSGVTVIGAYAFSGCSKLTDIQFQGTVEEWKGIYKGGSWNYHITNYTITCTDGTVDKEGNVTYFDN